MTKHRSSAVVLATLIVIAAMSISVDAQAIAVDNRSVVSKSATIGLKIAFPSERVSMGQKPWVSLTVTNLSRQAIIYPWDRVYVDGPKGEPPTTLHQRQATHRLKAGEPDIAFFNRGTEPLIAAGASFTRRYDLSGFYDFTEPGKYTVYIDVLDDLAPETKTGGGLWVRSPVATFEVLASAR